MSIHDNCLQVPVHVPISLISIMSWTAKVVVLHVFSCIKWYHGSDCPGEQWKSTLLHLTQQTNADSLVLLDWYLQDNDDHYLAGLATNHFFVEKEVSILGHADMKSGLSEKVSNMKKSMSSLGLIGFRGPASEASAITDLVVSNSEAFYWLLPGPPNILPEKLRLTSLVFFYECREENLVTLKETYSIKTQIRVETEISRSFEGHWTILANSSMWQRRSDLKGVTLVNSILPFAYFNKKNDNSQDEIPYVGFLQDILNILQEQLNFKVPKW